MRGADAYNEALFSTVRLEDFVPAKHPLRPIRQWVKDALSKMDARFSAMYEADVKGGRPSIAPEKLMRAMLLQVLYSVRSERQLVEQIQYNLLFRWFVGLAIEDTVWNHSVFSKNRDRLIEHDAVTELLNATVQMAEQRGLLSGEHFSVDGTLIQAWASHKSLRRKDGSDDGRPPEDWRGQPRSNDTHESTRGLGRSRRPSRPGRRRPCAAILASPLQGAWPLGPWPWSITLAPHGSWREPETPAWTVRPSTLDECSCNLHQDSPFPIRLNFRKLILVRQCRYWPRKFLAHSFIKSFSAN
jgi:transposase